MKNKSRKRKQMMISAAIVVCVAAIVAGCFIKNVQDREALQIGSISMGSGASAESSVVHYKGKAYQYNQNLMNVLFLGIDTTQDLSQEDMPGDAGQSDCILIVSMDKQKKTARLLQVSRDTMTDIDTYDVSGNYVSTVQGQLALQYAYLKIISILLHEFPHRLKQRCNIFCLALHSAHIAAGNICVTLSYKLFSHIALERNGRTFFKRRIDFRRVFR